MWIIGFMSIGVVLMAVLAFSVLTIMKKEGEAQEAEHEESRQLAAVAESHTTTTGPAESRARLLFH